MTEAEARGIIFDVCETPDQASRVTAALEFLEKQRVATGETSDGYHTFNDLYDHRITLFIALCSQITEDHGVTVWRSRLHSDGTFIDGWFIMGIGEAPGEQITYHLPLDLWAATSWVPDRDRAPWFDGHTSADVLVRLRGYFRK